MTPELHAGLLGAAASGAIVFALVILARNPRSTPARMHAVYGAAAAWWFLCMALLATGNGLELWGRLAHLSVGMFPGIIFHLNVATAGVAQEHQRGIRVHYALSGVVTLFSLGWPVFLDSPNVYSWGPYVAYSWAGLVPVGLLAVTFAEVLRVYRGALRRAEPGSALEEKLRAFYQGNMIAAVALIDFVPAFGIGIYPFAYIIMTVMNAATMFGTVRFRLIEITPEFAAEQILETLPDAVIAVDSQHVVRLANEAAARVFGHDLSDLLDAPLSSVVRAPDLLEALKRQVSAPPEVRELSFEGADGQDYIMRLADQVLLDQVGGPVARVWVLHDLTAQRVAEAEREMFEGWVRKGQRLESLGVLAGGIAHDFNNLLTVILGQSDIARARTENGDAVDEQLSAIVVAAEHAGDLTSQMLTYAGRGDAVASSVDLNALTHDIGELLAVAISKKARLEFDLAGGLPLVHVDESQMSQVLMNLITNASDALGDAPGSITVRTGFYDADSALDHGLESAETHVFIEVTDTGVGMDSETKAHIFDPFYTTKFTGRGLGLATVFGIVQAHRGSIRVESEPGRGTRFTVALPAAVAGQPTSQPDAAAKSLVGRASGVALLVDDEREVRAVANEMLVTAGFDVVEAVNGIQAVAEFRAREDEIALVLLDVTMPEMDGAEALAEIRSHSVDVPIILMSGFAGTTVIDLEDDKMAWFLKKPFRASDLAARLDDAKVSTR